MFADTFTGTPGASNALLTAETLINLHRDLAIHSGWGTKEIPAGVLNSLLKIYSPGVDAADCVINEFENFYAEQEDEA